MAVPAGGSVAVVLAAGGGSRFRGEGVARHKLLAPFRGRTVVWWAVSHALEACPQGVWVVAGATALEGAVPEGATLVANPDWSRGQATSLQAAVRLAASQGLASVVVGLGDQPLVPPEAWRAVAASESDIAVATYHGRRRNPVRLASRVWHLLPESGDEGARVLMRARPELVEEVPCPGDPVDIDTREDWQRWS